MPHRPLHSGLALAIGTGALLCGAAMVHCTGDDPVLSNGGVPDSAIDAGGTDSACVDYPPPSFDAGTCVLDIPSAGSFLCPGANSCNSCSGVCCYSLGGRADCNANGSSCTGPSTWACDGRDSCGTGLCCVRLNPDLDSGTCPRPDGTGASTGCIANACASGELQVCRNSGECPADRRCTAVSTNPRGLTRIVGVCTPL